MLLVECKYKIVKSAKFSVKKAVSYIKMLKCYKSSWWSGRSSKFCGLLIHQRRGDRAVGSGGFCFSPVIASLFFVASVLYMLEMQVSLLRSWCVVYVGDASVSSS
jgi:hypothetical protein